MANSNSILYNLPGIPLEISVATCREEMFWGRLFVIALPTGASNWTFEDNYCKALDKPDCSQSLLDKRGCKNFHAVFMVWFSRLKKCAMYSMHDYIQLLCPSVRTPQDRPGCASNTAVVSRRHVCRPISQPYLHTSTLAAQGQFLSSLIRTCLRGSLPVH